MVILQRHLFLAQSFLMEHFQTIIHPPSSALATLLIDHDGKRFWRHVPLIVVSTSFITTLSSGLHHKELNCQCLTIKLVLDDIYIRQHCWHILSFVVVLRLIVTTPLQSSNRFEIIFIWFLQWRLFQEWRFAFVCGFLGNKSCLFRRVCRPSPYTKLVLSTLPNLCPALKLEIAWN